jgi:hypothetical protein
VAAHIAGVRLVGELVDPAHPILERGVKHGLGPSGPQKLRPVGPEIGDRPDRDHRAGLGGTSSAHTGDDRVAARHRNQQLPRGLGHARSVGAVDDRRECAVDVEEHSSARRRAAQRRERLGQ